ncbi:MAG: helix-turn-helix domain-containing protein [Clostridia bacterium]|nr:helix-turn-helix domain-containing protein [Clostridia bacterium]
MSLDFYELEKDKSNVFSQPFKCPEAVTHSEAIRLWETAMRSVQNEKGELLLATPETASWSLARKIEEFMCDEKHIYERFDGEEPKNQDIYKAAGIGKSTWGRIKSGELPDVERGNVFALAIALRLDEKQTEELLYSAGFVLNYALDLDRAMMYFIKKGGFYNMKKVYAILGEFCDVTNGLDCFVFRPRTEKQRVKRTKKPIK